MKETPKPLGKMRCPVGAVVSKARHGGKILDERNRCPREGSVSRHAKLSGILVVYCPAHEAVDCSEAIWEKFVERP